MASLINDRLNGDTSDDGDSLILPFAESLDSVYLKSFFLAMRLIQISFNLKTFLSYKKKGRIVMKSKIKMI